MAGVQPVQVGEGVLGRFQLGEPSRANESGKHPAGVNQLVIRYDDEDGPGNECIADYRRPAPVQPNRS